MEDKQQICNLLLPALRQTRCGEDIVCMIYHRYPSKDEYVNVIFRVGYVIPVNVTADSGKAMITDILRQL